MVPTAEPLPDLANDDIFKMRSEKCDAVRKSVIIECAVRKQHGRHQFMESLNLKLKLILKWKQLNWRWIGLNEHKSHARTSQVGEEISNVKMLPASLLSLQQSPNGNQEWKKMVKLTFLSRISRLQVK
jgi:hypothetical protein